MNYEFLIDNGYGFDTRVKCSPDGRLREWKVTREIASIIVLKLQSEGISARLLVPEERDVPLAERCRRANTIHASAGDKKVLLVSIHINAAGSDGKWHKATGWEAWTSPGPTKADILAEHLYKAAEEMLINEFENGNLKIIDGMTPQKMIRRDLSDGDNDKEARFMILTNTRCPAVLTENLFQDNRRDVDYLLSKAGQEAIADLHVRGIKEACKHGL